MSSLRIDRETILPVIFTYVSEEHLFRTMSDVRLYGRTVTSMDVPGPDTLDGRDHFLEAVLARLMIPPREAQRLVRTATHWSDMGFPPAETSVEHVREPRGEIYDDRRHDRLARRARRRYERAYRRPGIRRLRSAERAFTELLDATASDHPDREDYLQDLAAVQRLLASLSGRTATWDTPARPSSSELLESVKRDARRREMGKPGRRRGA